MPARKSKLTRVERTTDSGTKYLEKVRVEDVKTKQSSADDAVVTSAKGGTSTGRGKATT